MSRLQPGPRYRFDTVRQCLGAEGPKKMEQDTFVLLSSDLEPNLSYWFSPPRLH